MAKKLNFNPQMFDLRIDLSNFKESDNPDASPFEIVNNIINEYFKYLDNPIWKTDSKILRDRALIDIVSKSYGIKTRYFTKEEIALLTGKTSERIRQRLIEFNDTLLKIINGEDEKFKINANCKKIIIEFYDSVNRTAIISLKNFKEIVLPFLGVDGNITNEEFLPYFGIFKIVQRSPLTHLLRNNTFLFIDSSIKIDEYFEICYLVYLYLEKSIIPVEIEDIIIDVKRKKPNTEARLIELACSEVLEVEKLSLETKFKYQIRLDCLSNANDMIYRLLNERKQFIKLAEIIREINHNLYLLKSGRKISNSISTTLASDGKFVSQGKTGFWGLTEWEGNNETLYDLITNTLVHFNKPLKKKEIFDYVLESRPKVPLKSLETMIYDKSRFLKLNDDTFIISGWKNIYKDQIVATTKRNRYVKENPIKDQIKEQVIQLLKRNGGSNLYLNTIINALNKKFKFVKGSVYKIISDNEEFVKSQDENKKVLVSLNSQLKEMQISRTDTSVFVSYSWESHAHQEKVISFVDFLRKTGFNADLDISMMQNETSVDFNKLMHAGIRKYDKVIIILSSSYKAKAEAFEGGVGKEYRYILNNMDKEKKKFILTSFLPITDENRRLIVPMGFDGKELVDLIKDEVNQFQYLFSKLTDSKQYNFSEVASGTPLVQKKEIKPFTLH
jgi:hypothetical protein